MTAAPSIVLATRALSRPLSRITLASMTLLGGCASLVAAGVAGQPPLPNTQPSTLARHDIPTTYLPLYLDAAKQCLGLPWTVLAGIGKVATDHGRRPLIAEPRAPGLDNASAAASPPPRIGVMGIPASSWTLDGTDSNRDGRTDPNDPADAIPTVASTLCGLQPSIDLRAAITAYWCPPNFSCPADEARYTDATLAWAGSYATLPVRAPQPGGIATGLSPDQRLTGPSGNGNQAAAGTRTGTLRFDPTAVQATLQQVLQVTLTVAVDQLGTPYRWGGEEPGGFDCSGLVQYAYGAAGLQLPRTAQRQHDAGPALTAAAMRDSRQLYPGDLLFFGTSPAHVTHVGMYVGLRNNTPTMIVAPHTGSNVQFQPAPLTGSWLVGATRPLARYLTQAPTAVSRS
jgi:cell wall-associated NlpC family hydrolase